MNEVIEKLCRIKTQYAINRLNPSSTDMIFIQYEELCLELNKQLQAYKEKEDKLRVELENFHTQFEIDETIPSHNLKTKKEILSISRQRIKNCLQILNEGRDGNETD